MQILLYCCRLPLWWRCPYQAGFINKNLFLVWFKHFVSHLPSRLSNEEVTLITDGQTGVMNRVATLLAEEEGKGRTRAACWRGAGAVIRSLSADTPPSSVKEKEASEMQFQHPPASSSSSSFFLLCIVSHVAPRELHIILSAC